MNHGEWTHKIVDKESKYWWYIRMSGITLHISCLYNREGAEVCGPSSYDTFTESVDELYKDDDTCDVYALNKFKGNK